MFTLAICPPVLTTTTNSIVLRWLYYERIDYSHGYVGQYTGWYQIAFLLLATETLTYNLVLFETLLLPPNKRHLFFPCLHYNALGFLPFTFTMFLVKSNTNKIRIAHRPLHQTSILQFRQTPKKVIPSQFPTMIPNIFYRVIPHHTCSMGEFQVRLCFWSEISFKWRMLSKRISPQGEHQSIDSILCCVSARLPPYTYISF